MDKKNILLVEDDFLNRRLSKKILLENGYNVLEAKNAKEALDILKKEDIGLAILDINLGVGEQDGISLGGEMQNRYSVPFVYVTAYENTRVINRAAETKPYSYLTKPFKNVDLIAAVEVAIRRSVLEAKHQQTIMVKDGEYNVALGIADIDYIESDGNYLLFYAGKKVYKIRSTIKQILEELPASSFAQTHRAYVVNKVKVEKYNAKCIVVNSKELPISKNHADKIGG
jgi:DNA-binding LytR/AlgR family response regulator